MTGPNPDAALDAALGITELPPAAVTDDHREAAYRAVGNISPTYDRVAQVIADAEQRGAARVIAEQQAAGVRLDGRLLAARENYGELTMAAEYHLDRCEAARADQTATGLPFAVGEARRRLTR